MKFKEKIIKTVFLILAVMTSSLQASESSKSSVAQIPIQINDTQVTLQEYQSVLRTEMRNRFYHLKIPEQDKKTFPMEVAEKIINQYLMLEDLKNQAVPVDMEWVNKQHDKTIKKMDRQYKDNKNWQAGKAQFSKELLDKLKKKNQLASLTKKIKTVAKPDQKDVLAYYKAHPDKFMAPVQQRVSVIIFSVPPSSNNATWDKARAKAKEVIEQLKQDKPFEVMAEIYSSDISAEMGGDMGFIHEGMLGKAAQKVIDKLKVGEISEPVTLLEGIALLKLTQRIPEKLNTFERVEPQASRMLQEERSERAWDNYLSSLRKNAKIILREDLINQAI